MEESTTTSAPRRRFLVCVIGAATAFIAAISVLPGVGYVLGPLLRPRVGKKAKVLLPDGQSLQPKFALARYEGQDELSPGIFCKLGEDGKPVVLSAVCPHAGCAVGLESSGEGFLCPCHAAKFDKDGKVVSGPSPRALDPLKAEMTGGVLTVELPEA
jgi:Rieske Fe-S protein